MLQSYEQYNVGVFLVRFIQLYSLSKKNPSKYNFKVQSCLACEFTVIKLNLVNDEGLQVSFKDLPNKIELNTNSFQGDTNIELFWKEDKLCVLSLNEDTGLIQARFSGNGRNVIKSSDDRDEHASFIGKTTYYNHRPQEEGPLLSQLTEITNTEKMGTY